MKRERERRHISPPWKATGHNTGMLWDHAGSLEVKWFKAALSEEQISLLGRDTHNV